MRQSFVSVFCIVFSHFHFCHDFPSFQRAMDSSDKLFNFIDAKLNSVYYSRNYFT